MKKAGMVMAPAGAALLVLTVLWVAIAASAFIKIPKGQEELARYSGEFVYYVDPLTYRPLAPGQELRLTAEIERHVFTLDEQFSGDLAPIREEVSAKAGIISKEYASVYVLDRSDSVNVADDRAYSWYPANVQDRSGAYYPLFPMGMVEGEAYPTWKAEAGQAICAKFLEKSTLEGIEVFMMEGSMDSQLLIDEYVEFREFPRTATLEQLAEELQARGADLAAMEVPAGTARQPIPLDYYMTSTKRIAVEPTAGYPMAILDAWEEVSVLPDFSSLDPALAQVPGLKETLASVEPRPVYTQAYTQTEESIRESAGFARKNMDLIRLARVIVPAVGFTLGGLLAVAGTTLILVARTSRRNRG